MSGRPRLCPRCGKLAGLERRCPSCGQNLGGLNQRLASFAQRNQEQGATVTVALIVIQIGIFLLMMAVGEPSWGGGGFEILSPDRPTLIRFGMQVPELVTQGHWWRLVMPVFLHLGLIHLAMNSLVLWVLGRRLEPAIGSFAFLSLYMAGGVLGFVASQFAHISGAGASGAVAAVIGALIVKRRLDDGHFRDPVTVMALQLVFINLLFGMAMPGLNHVAHGVGFAVGLFGGWVFARLLPPTRGAGLYLAVAAASALLSLSAGMMAFRWEIPLRMQDAGAAIHRVNQAMRCTQILGEAEGEAERPSLELYERTLRCLKGVRPTELDYDAFVEDFQEALIVAYQAQIRDDKDAENRALLAAWHARAQMGAWIRRENTRF